MVSFGRPVIASVPGNLSVPLRRRPPRWWQPWVALAMVLALAGSIMGVRDPVVLLSLRSLANEWIDCARNGSPPAPQPDIAAELHRRLAGNAPPAPPPPDLRLPIVRPKLQLATTVDRRLTEGGAAPRRVVVAVLDSGVAADHRDIAAGNVLPGIDVINPCGNGHDDVTGHGTAVAGVLLSSHHGAAPQVDVLPIRMSLATGRHSGLLSALGIVMATRRGADIINMSYTMQGPRPSILEWMAVRYAHHHGVAMVAAAGNDPSKPAGYPAAFGEVLSVTAVDRQGDLAERAARTGHIDVAATGSRVLTLSPDGSLRVASGTSLAAPLVSAALVHMLRADPSVVPSRAVATVRETNGPQPEAVIAERFGAFNFSAALAGICAISSACQLSAALYPVDERPTGPAIGDPLRLPRPGEPR